MEEAKVSIQNKDAIFDEWHANKNKEIARAIEVSGIADKLAEHVSSLDLSAEELPKVLSMVQHKVLSATKISSYSSKSNIF